MTASMTDHRAEASNTLNLAATWLAAQQPDPAKAQALALIGIGHALLAGLPSTITVNAPNLPEGDLIDMMLGRKAAAEWTYDVTDNGVAT